MRAEAEGEMTVVGARDVEAVRIGDPEELAKLRSLVRLADGQSAIPFIFRASWTSSEVTPPASWVERSTTTLFQTLNHSG